MCRALHHAARSIIRGAATLNRCACSIKRGARDQSHILRHAVITVSDVIALLKMQERVARARARRHRATAAAHAKAPKQLMLGNKHQRFFAGAIPTKSAVQMLTDHLHSRARRVFLRKLFGTRHVSIGGTK